MPARLPRNSSQSHIPSTLRAGPPQWFDLAAAPVAEACRAAVSLLEARGLEVRAPSLSPLSVCLGWTGLPQGALTAGHQHWVL